MYLHCLLPIVAFPVIGFFVQGVAVMTPDPSLLEKYGPLGILAAWLMWHSYRQEKRYDKLVGSLGQIASAIHSRPCLYELEFDNPEGKRKQST